MSARAIDELREGFEAPFRSLGRDAGRDSRTIVLSWPSVPIELVRAAGFEPVFARGRHEPTPAADRVLEPNLFPNRLRQLVEAALTGRLAAAAAVVLPRSSDPDYKCFLYLRELARRGTVTTLPPVSLFDLLHSRDPSAGAYNAERARALWTQLAALAGRRPETEEVHAAIAAANRARGGARRLAALRTGTPRIAGAEALALLGAFWQVEPERYARLAHAAADEASGRAPLAGRRVLVAGSPVDGSSLHAALEAEGVIVVAELSPFGSRCAGADVEASDDAFAALASHYARHAIDARLPVRAWLRGFDELLSEVDAVVLSLPADDASFGWDYPRIRERLARLAIPHAVLTGDPACGVTPAERDRLRSLLERARGQRESRRG